MKKVDFILTNTAIYVELSSRYNISRIVTMKNDILDRSYTMFGGVFFTRADRNDITSVKDMHGRNIRRRGKNLTGRLDRPLEGTGRPEY